MRINSAPHRPLSYRGKRMEAQTGVEPVWTDLQSVAWPLCYRAEEEKKWRPAGESNPWLPPGQGGTLATELAERKEKKKKVARTEGVEPSTAGFGVQCSAN
jgi:hypothetical protein